jgi:hypothetical protein
MKAQLMLDEDEVSIEDLIEKYKLSIDYTHRDGELLPFWTANLISPQGVTLAIAAGNTLRDAVEGMVGIIGSMDLTV